MTALPPVRKEGEIYFPNTEGKPMMESDFQGRLLSYTVETIGYPHKTFYGGYIPGNLMAYNEKWSAGRTIIHDVFLDIEETEKDGGSSIKLWSI